MQQQEPKSIVRFLTGAAAISLSITLAANPGAAAGEKPYAQAEDPWYQAGRAALDERLALQPNTNRAKNVILFIGDGMGVSTITAARIFDGQSRGETGEENSLSFERFPYAALVKTYNTNQQVSDSAGTATAMNSGVKTRAGVIGVSEAAHRGNCAEGQAHAVATFGELAEESGRATGIVTTARLTHATPAAVYAHSPERGWENDSEMAEDPQTGDCSDIARQLIDFSAGNGIDVAMGGGRRNFFGKDKGGGRLDASADLASEWQARHNDGVYVDSGSALAALDLGKANQLLGLFSPSHMAFEVQRTAGTDEPSLSEMTAAALDILSRDDDGFYLMVESGRIDHGHHGGFAALALTETQEFSRAIDVALSKVDLSETLILVTADHSHTLTIAGYPTRGNPILGVVQGNDHSGEPTGSPTLAEDGHPYTTLGYANGPGAVQGARGKPDTSSRAPQQALVPTAYRDKDGEVIGLLETHAGEDVALFATGPWAHLVSGVMEQNVIFHIMAHAMGLETK